MRGFSTRTGLPRAGNQSVLTPLTRSVQDLFGALATLGLDGYAKASGVATDDDDDELGLALDDDQPGETQMPSTEWLRAYVTFDGWDWTEITHGERRLTDATTT